MNRRGVRVAAAGLVLLTLLGACGSSSSSGPGGSPAASPSPTSTDPTVAVVGMTQVEAEAWAAEHGYTVRIASVDGVPRSLTMDYRADRINISLEQGVVVKATVG